MLSSELLLSTSVASLQILLTSRTHFNRRTHPSSLGASNIHLCKHQKRFATFMQPLNYYGTRSLRIFKKDFKHDVDVHFMDAPQRNFRHHVWSRFCRRQDKNGQYHFLLLVLDKSCIIDLVCHSFVE